MNTRQQPASSRPETLSHQGTRPARANLCELVNESRARLEAAEANGPDATTIEALRRCVDWLEASLAADAEPLQAYDGYIDYTIDDESFETHFRQFDVRVYYTWDDYDRDDEPFASWGANIERCEVLAVRYFDEAGNELTENDYQLDEALRLVEENREQVTEACTADGYRHGAGLCHPLYSSSIAAPLAAAGTSATAGADATAAAAGDPPAPRMAPSSRTRQTQQDRRELG